MNEIYVVTIAGDYEQTFLDEDDAFIEVANLLRMNADESGWDELRRAMWSNPQQTVEQFFRQMMDAYDIEVSTFQKKEIGD